MSDLACEEEIQRKKWISVLSTGIHSDTYVFVVGEFGDRVSAITAAEELKSKAVLLYERHEMAEDSCNYDLTQQIQQEHEKLFGMEGEWFPPRHPDDWRVSAAEVGDVPAKVF